MNQTQPLQAKAYEYIKDKILSGELLADTLYSETKIAKDLSISRTPLRDAIQSLSQDGYITIVPSKGFTIRKLNRKDLVETIQIRCAIEGFSAYRAAQGVRNGQGGDFTERLQSRLTAMEDALRNVSQNEEELARFIAHDHDFHLTIINYVNNEQFLREFQRIHYLVRQTSETALSHPGRMEETLAEHQQVFQAIRDGEPTKAYEAMIAHLIKPLTLFDGEKT